MPTRLTSPWDAMTELSRADIKALRETMKMVGVFVAETDLELRFLWVDNLHPQQKAISVIGKTAKQWLAEPGGEMLLAMQQGALKHKHAVSGELQLQFPDGIYRYTFRIYPIRNDREKIDGLMHLGFPREAKPLNTGKSK